MALVFERVRYKNLLSTGNDFTEISLSDSKTTLIIGKNGEGKSTILDALCFGLYNKPFRKINKPALVNSVNSKGLLVEVEFYSGKDKFLVRRGMKPNIFEIEKNDIAINQAAAIKDYQEILEKYILKMSYKAFCQVVILGSASFVPFMQLPAAHRREIIEDILEIEIFTVMNTLLKEKAGVNARDILDIDYQFDLNNEKIKMHEEHMKSILTNSQSQIDDFQSKINKYKTTVLSEIVIIEEKRSEQEILITQTVDYEKLQLKSSSMHILKNQMNDRIGRLTEEVNFFTLHDNCPTCHQIIDEAFKNDAVKNSTKLIGEVEVGVESINRKYADTEHLIQNLKQTMSKISDINTDINIRKNKIKSIEGYINDLNEQISTIVKKNDEFSSDNKTLKLLEDNLVKISAEKIRLFEIKEIYKLCNGILKDTGIKAKIIKQYIPIINKLINKYLAAMDFFVQFELDENFNETIKSRFRDDFSYASFSEGEKAKIDLALLFTWRTVSKLRNSASTNVLILDEVFDGSLDSGSSEDLLKILMELSNDSNIMVISHKTDQLLDKFDRIIKFEKKQNFSRIAE